MTLSEIADRVVKGVGGMKSSDALAYWYFVQTTMEEVSRVLSTGQEVKIRGLGRFYWRPVKPRTTVLKGKKIEVPGGWKLKFIPSGSIRRTKMSEDGMTKYGVVLDKEKTKTASEGAVVEECPDCRKALDSGGACPVHGTKPFEKERNPDGSKG